MANKEKLYTLRNIESTDVFGLVKILKKIGVSKFKTLFTDKSNQEEQGLKFIEVIIDGICDAEEEIYSFLATLSGLKVDEIKKLDGSVFLQMIYDVFDNPKFKDFIGVAFKFAK